MSKKPKRCCGTCKYREITPYLWSSSKGDLSRCGWRIPNEWPIADSLKFGNRSGLAFGVVGMKDGAECPTWAAEPKGDQR